MTKSELNSLIDQKVEQLFSTSDLYSSVRKSAFDACNKYCAEKGEDAGFTIQTDFMDEYVFRAAVSTAMKETLNFFIDNNLISIND